MFLATHDPVLDYGWRVALYPPGTLLDDAIDTETLIQGGRGFTVDPSSASLVPNYFIRSTSDTLRDGEDDNDWDHGWRNAPAVLGTVVVRYRVSGPGIHTP